MPGHLNDFADYWLAARIVGRGGNPYDIATLVSLVRADHLDVLVGTGCSYPPPFALALAPLGGLPFRAAGWAFTAIPLAAFGAAAGAWISRLAGSRRWHGMPVAPAMAVAAGLYLP